MRTGVARLLDASGVVDVALTARRMLRIPLFPVLTYHGVAAPDYPPDLDDDVVDATPEGFDRHVAFLRRRFTLVGIDDLRAHFLDGRELPPNPAMITFDDGYRSCRDVALPILARHGARAVFFVSTGHLNDRKLFWWDRVNLLVARARRRRAVIDYPTRIEVHVAPATRRATIQTLLRVVKDTRGLDVEQYLAAIAAALDVPWSDERERELADRVLLTWDHVRELKRAGMDVESHTRTHRMLHTLDDASVAHELRASREELERELGEAVHAIAYPVGAAPDARTIRAAREAGYALGFSNGTGINLLRGAPAPFELRRIAMDRAVSDSYLRAVVAVPMLAHERRARGRDER